MKQMFKRVFTLMMAVLTIGSTAIPASAAEATPYASSYLAAYSSGVTSSGTTIYVDFTVSAVGTQDEVGVYSITAHQLQSDGTWKALSTTYHSTSNNFVAYNTYFHAGTYTYQGTAGNTYRFGISVFAGGEDGSDARSFYTQNITI